MVATYVAGFADYSAVFKKLKNIMSCMYKGWMGGELG